MKTPARLSRTLTALRPRTRRGRILAAIGIGFGAVALSGVLFVAAAMGWDPYLQFSLDHSTHISQAAAKPLDYASSSICAQCHEPEHARLVSATHKTIGCQSCHGPLAAHADAGDKAASEQVAVKVPTNEVCVRCHAASTGRPSGMREIIPGQHYISECLQCHDPHTGIANRPPVVRHPLTDLPPCITCHGSEGFKARNLRHPDTTTDDKECLLCHAAGRGPAVDGLDDTGASN
ncbi:MAG: hypothetical protein WCK58_17570, partial [Chloroflexota bacterium]